MSYKGSLCASALTLLGALGAIGTGICPCSPYTLSSIALILLSALLVGNGAFEALTSEREKKTLDCLRLTQLTADQVLFSKIKPELRLLSHLLIVLGPTVLVTSILGDAGFGRGLMVLAVATVAGVLSSTMALAISSLSSHTSRAVVAGWCAKFVWLALTSVFDQVLAAVMVSERSAPIFDSLNPLAAAGVLVLPEGQTDSIHPFVPLFFIVAGSLASFLCWRLAARRFDNGMVASARLTDRRVHPIYSNRGVRTGLLSRVPGVQTNPVLARELVSQLRSGAGSWPGYLVFLVLLLAPFIYTDSWAVKREMQASAGDTGYTASAPLQISNEPELKAQADSRPTPIETGVHMRTSMGTELLLKNHTSCGCFRLLAHQLCDVPLPLSEVVRVVVPTDIAMNTPAAPGGVAPLESPVSPTDAVKMGITSQAPSDSDLRQLDSERLSAIHLQSIQIGLVFALTILLAYLTIRLSGSTATAVTSEVDRRSWTDLALAGVSPQQFLNGKLMGALLLPIWQMSVAFPAILFFVVAGALGPFEALGLYIYVVGLAVLAGVTGLWASVVSKSSHHAQGRALACVVYGCLASLPLVILGGAGAIVASLVLACFVGVKSAREVRALLGLTVASLCVTSSLSPLTAVMSFLPSLGQDGRLSFVRHLADVGSFSALVSWVCAMAVQSCLTYLLWSGAVRRLTEQAGGDSLRADLAA